MRPDPQYTQLLQLHSTILRLLHTCSPPPHPTLLYSPPNLICLIRVEGTLNALRYLELLEKILVPKLPKQIEDMNKLIAQQDSTSCHSAKSTKTLLKNIFTKAMKWSALSPDLNPIEIIRGIMVRIVYFTNKQHSFIDELQYAVFAVWEKISEATVSNLETP